MKFIKKLTGKMGDEEVLGTHEMSLIYSYHVMSGHGVPKELLVEIKKLTSMIQSSIMAICAIKSSTHPHDEVANSLIKEQRHQLKELFDEINELFGAFEEQRRETFKVKTND